MVKQPNFFYSQPSALPKEGLAKFYVSATFGVSFMIISVASTSYAYLITKIGNRGLNFGQLIALGQVLDHLITLKLFEVL